MTPKLAGGRNIALKVPPHLYDATVQFYRDVVGLERCSKITSRPWASSSGPTSSGSIVWAA